jgi:hypothetical protein
MISICDSLVRAAALEHFEHAVRNKESTYYVAGGGDNGDSAQHGRERALALADQDNRSYDGDSVERVGQRHQWSVQQGRNVADDFEADEAGQHKDKQRIDQVFAHEVLQFSSQFTVPSSQQNALPEIYPAATSAGSLKNSRTLAFTTSPARVTIVSRIISSCTLSCSLPSFTM